MSNISQCKHNECEKSNSCYRFLAKPESKDQAYNKFENICTPENNYKWYWEVKDTALKEGG